MRAVSLKRQKLNREVGPWRQNLRERVGRCEMCLRPKSPENLDVHELVPGSSRSKALDKVFAVLCVCRPCHNDIERLTIPNQLAYLYISRPTDFELPLYYELIGRRWPDWDDVYRFVRVITQPHRP